MTRPPVDHHSTVPMIVPMLSAMMSLSDTVRGGKKICVNSMAALRPTPTTRTTPETIALPIHSTRP